MNFGKILLFSICFVATQSIGQTTVNSASEKIGLQESIETALRNNISIRQSQLQVDRGINDVAESRYRRYPTVNGGTNLNAFLGRNINPFTNEIITNAVGSNGFGIQSRLLLFDGYQTRNNIELTQLTLNAANSDLQAIKNDISLRVAVAYINVLTQQDLLEVAQKQIEVTKIQLERSDKLVKAGALPETNLYDIKAQLANDELQEVNAQNNVESAKLTLKQLMNISADRNIEPIRIPIPDPSVQAYPLTAQQIYEIAIGYLPDVQAAETRIKMAQKSVDIAKGLKMPTVSASAGWNTTTTTAAERMIASGTIDKRNLGNVDFNGQKIPLVIETPGTISEKIPYFSQFTGNMNTNVGVSLQVPIFNGYNAKFRLAGAQIQQKQSELQADNTKIQIRQSIDQAYINMSNAAKRYTSTQNQVRALEETFRAAEARLGAGSINTLDYNIAKTNLDRAKANLVLAKYDYVFRTKVLDFYQNKPLSL
ncbi:MAG: TolC family protein [Spirosomaceae bacterium]|nr:TolC family protein [Spirosomataceae bacterium]